MIVRLWHGWTTQSNADEYETLLRSEILPGINRIPGFRGAEVLRRESEAGVEFVTLTLFDSIEAVRAFAGEDYEAAVVLPKARKLLSRFDQRSVHYQSVLRTEPNSRGTST
jgi:heme-degrading monooxygenase HmoA